MLIEWLSLFYLFSHYFSIEPEFQKEFDSTLLILDNCHVIFAMLILQHTKTIKPTTYIYHFLNRFSHYYRDKMPINNIMFENHEKGKNK